MTQLINSLAHRSARNAASIALADAGPQASTIRVFASEGGTLLGVRLLAKPCGSIRPDGRIALVAAEAAVVAVATGSARWAGWFDGHGVAISSGRVTDPAGRYTDEFGVVVDDPQGQGPFVLGGSAGTMVYAGGLVLLYAGLIG